MVYNPVLDVIRKALVRNGNPIAAAAAAAARAAPRVIARGRLNEPRVCRANQHAIIRRLFASPLRPRRNNYTSPEKYLLGVGGPRAAAERRRSATGHRSCFRIIDPRSLLSILKTGTTRKRLNETVESDNGVNDEIAVVPFAVRARRRRPPAPARARPRPARPIKDLLSLEMPSLSAHLVDK
ncbi:hypothetical protein EVAR_91503_1 [Eumeta japonica]|uniref:Uncharacterized protein n=1 Tax=Eumeta variegata TaxID=151549 RepID=A0A4C1VCC7_EUMVA|nr:hypothetical protein EVAR_91503_1 [Eumeta japonica]